jgi:hypothetical protein
MSKISVVILLLLIAGAALDSLAGALGFGTLATVGGSFNNLVGALKIRYDNNFLGAVGWSKGPLGAMIKKVAWTGKNVAYPMRIGNSPARSATFSVVKAKSEDATFGFTSVAQPTLTWFRDYGRATIDGLLLATAGDKLGTFYDDMVLQVDGIMDATMHSFCTKVYRAGYGKIGVVDASTNLATTALVVQDLEDMYLFEKNMDIQFALTDSSGNLKGAAGFLTVVGIAYATKTLTLNAAINSLGGVPVAAGDAIFARGDRIDSATPARSCIAGLDAWLPTVQPSSGDSFFGMPDRSTDSRLIGTILDASSLTEEEALIKLAAECARVGGKPKMGYINPTRYANLLLQGQAKYRPATVTGPAGIGFDGVQVKTQFGDITVFPDLYCMKNRLFLLEMPSWKAYGAGSSKIPDILRQDGNKILRMTDEDAIECRAGYYGTVGCNAPCHNGVAFWT